MDGWVDRVFFDGKHFPGGIPKRDLPKVKAEYEAFARKVLAESGADHVVYCFVEYENGEPTTAHFHSGLKMADDEFYKETGELTGDFYIGAVHRLK